MNRLQRDDRLSQAYAELIYLAILELFSWAWVMVICEGWRVL